MIMQLSDALARAALNQRERRVVERLVVQLGEELGGDLRCVWLYGSRARGEADPSEADPDRRSDIDLMVIADGGARRYGAKVNDLRHEIAWAEGDEPAFFSVFVHDISSSEGSPGRLRPECGSASASSLAAG